MKHIIRILYRTLCVTGLVSGAFLLLCCLGVVDPALLFQREETAVLQTAAPAELPAGEEAPEEKCLTLTADQIDQAGARSAGYDAVLLPMQNENGSLNYVSALPLAVESGASWGDPTRNESLRALNARADLHTAAEVSCLRDQILGQNDPALFLRRVSGSPWRDGAGYGWLDPANDRVRAYLVGVCRELADLGFDEIVLTHCAYPTEGAAACLRPLGDKTGTLETLLRQIQGAVADWGTEVSLRACPDADEAASASGQTAALLAVGARVWDADPGKFNE